MGTTRFVSREEWDALERLMLPENRAAIRLALATGLRISDALSLKKADLKKAMDGDGHISVFEQKTGKKRRVFIGKKLQRELKALPSNSSYVFAHRFDKQKHRTREAVYKDLCRAADALRLDGVVAPHSARKSYTVEYMRAGHNLLEAQRLLRHSKESVTVIYAFADMITANQTRSRKRARRSTVKESP